MPKIKTHRGAAKRFNLTKKGKVKMNKAFRRHILNKKSTKRERHLRKFAIRLVFKMLFLSHQLFAELSDTQLRISSLSIDLRLSRLRTLSVFSTSTLYCLMR